MVNVILTLSIFACIKFRFTSLKRRMWILILISGYQVLSFQYGQMWLLIDQSFVTISISSILLLNYTLRESYLEKNSVKFPNKLNFYIIGGSILIQAIGTFIITLFTKSILIIIFSYAIGLVSAFLLFKIFTLKKDLFCVNLLTKSIEQLKVLKIGEYIEFGKYYNEPIIWECVSKNENGILLLSKYIICLKAFDSAESGKCDIGNSDEEKMGSNKWEISNLREWLNSEDTVVKYTTQAPIQSAIDDPTTVNEYVDEPGFLTNFSQYEKKQISTIKHDGVDDKVFLLSKEELKKIWAVNNLRVKYNTKLSLEKSNYTGLDTEDAWIYWTRSSPVPFKLMTGIRKHAHKYIPNLSYMSTVSTVCNDGSIIDLFYAYSAVKGVVPAIYLKPDIS